MNDAVLQYVEPIYRFCLKRLASRADAEDLSQEILLCILQIDFAKVSNLDGYVWRVAHNRYARMIQARKGEAVVLYGHEHFPATANEEDDSENAVFTALHTLSTMYRDIMVDYYVRQLDTRAIAQRHNISVEAVKWRLHVGREKIKERMTHMEKNYERVKMHVMCNGGFDPNKYLNTQLQKAIAKVCYDSPLTLEEISLATGVPTLYIEDVLEDMTWGDAIEQIGSKFATNLIITPAGMQMDSFLNEAMVGEITDSIWNYIQSTESQVREIGFYGKDFDIAHLLHILVPAIVYVKSNNNARQVFPPRKDGGHGWFIVNEGLEKLDWRFAGMNGYAYNYNSSDKQAGRFNYFWVGDTFSQTLSALLSGKADFYINGINPNHTLTIPNEEDAATATAHNLCAISEGKIIPSIPIFTEEQYSNFLAWARKCNGFESLWGKWINALKSEYKSFTPKRLADQIDGNINAQAFNLSAYVIKELQ
ncbi:MAG: RNA polymerase sigma factor, partial [Defluviitaleaceae bacterium]|nr:RNA polymerase sigma factor [Defluviitaleaceae bacterium]